MGLYQNALTAFNNTATVAGTVNGASFSAANLTGGIALTITGTVTGTSPTVVVNLQLSVDGGATWTTIPAAAGGLAALTATSATPAAGTVATALNTNYVGNLLRVQVVFGGTGSLSIPYTVKLDMQKRFPDNA